MTWRSLRRSPRPRKLLARICFEIVLLDYDLPDGKGTDLFSMLDALPARPVVIAISSHAEGNDKLVEAGADLVCSKMRFGEMEAKLEQASAIIATRRAPAQQPEEMAPFAGRSWETLPEDDRRVWAP